MSEAGDQLEMSTHLRFMDVAVQQAQKAAAAGEVPVGAVLVGPDGNILACGYNRCIGLSDPTAHAEILAIREAAAHAKNYRLLNTTLYVTIEPCPMCMGAVIQARLARVVFGTRDPRWGAAGSLYDFPADRRFNHAPEVVAGVREEVCRAIMIDFFTARRGRQCP